MESKPIPTWIKGYENHYSITPDGDVYTYKFGKIKKITPGIGKDLSRAQYCNISLSLNGTSKTVRIHRIVAETFIPNPDNKPCVNHINGIKTDNRVENLEWVNVKENAIHARDVLGIKRKQQNPLNRQKGFYSRKPILKLSLDGNLICEYRSITSAARENNIKGIQIIRAINGRGPLSRLFIWKYKIIDINTNKK
jgi:hypothetical protein